MYELEAEKFELQYKYMRQKYEVWLLAFFKNEGLGVRELGFWLESCRFDFESQQDTIEVP